MVFGLGGAHGSSDACKATKSSFVRHEKSWRVERKAVVVKSNRFKPRSDIRGDSLARCFRNPLEDIGMAEFAMRPATWNWTKCGILNVLDKFGQTMDRIQSNGDNNQGYEGRHHEDFNERMFIEVKPMKMVEECKLCTAHQQMVHICTFVQVQNHPIRPGTGEGG